MTYLQQECENVIFIGATYKDPNGLKSDNTAVRLNTAILSRFNYQFELDLPQPKDIKEAWNKLIKTQSGKEKFTDKQNEIIAQKFHKLGMSYRDIKNISNKLNIDGGMLNFQRLLLISVLLKPANFVLSAESRLKELISGLFRQKHIIIIF